MMSSLMLSRKAMPTASATLYVLAKRKYEKNYVKKVKTDAGEVRIYDDAHVKQRWKRKVKSLEALKRNLPKLQKKYKQDLKSDDLKTAALAAVVAVLDLTAMRIGNDDSVEEFGTFGATTLKKKHVKISGSKVKFKFLGKKKVDQEFGFSDSAVASTLKKLMSGKGNNDFVFEYEDGKRIRAKVVNRYLADFDITAKDLRGYHANRLMRDELKKTKDFDKALEDVSEQVGHEPKTLMNQYLDPALVKKYKTASAQFLISDYVNRELSKIFGTHVASPKITKKAPPAAPKLPEKSEQAGDLAGRQRITSPFGHRIDPITKKPGKFHGGIDMHAPEGAEIYAFAAGVVAKAEDTGGASGKMVRLVHGGEGKTESMYMHLSKILVSPGDRVRKGQLIGLAGSTGRATGPHLHFVIKHNSKLVDPAQFLADRIIVGS